MSLKSAGIKTVRDAIERLMNGEVFYLSSGAKLIYDEANMLCLSGSVNPFKIVGNDGFSEPINGLWEGVSDWQIEYKWEDDVGDGVLCWVSDCNCMPSNNDFLTIIVKHDKELNYPYRTRSSGYKFATPLTLEEAKTYTKG